MVEIWAVMEFNPFKVINPTLSGGWEKNSPWIRSSIRKKSSQKISAQKIEKWQGYGLLFNFTLLGLLTLTKVGEGKKLVPRLDPIYVKSHHKKF